MTRAGPAPRPATPQTRHLRELFGCERVDEQRADGAEVRRVRGPERVGFGLGEKHVHAVHAVHAVGAGNLSDKFALLHPAEVVRQIRESDHLDVGDLVLPVTVNTRASRAID